MGATRLSRSLPLPDLAYRYVGREDYATAKAEQVVGFPSTLEGIDGINRNVSLDGEYWGVQEDLARIFNARDWGLLPGRRNLAGQRLS